MSISLYSVSPNASAESSPTGMAGIGEKLTDVMRTHDARITDDIKAALEPGSPLMRVPDTVRARFRQLENASLPDEQKRLIKEVKARVIELYENNSNFVESKTQSKIDSIYTEITAKAAGKTMSAIQQLLSEK